MSQQLINLSQDLLRLRNEGYELRIKPGYLIVGHIPYLNANKEIKYGALVSNLAIAGNKTTKPDTHVIHFSGEFPCNKDGSKIVQIEHASERKAIVDDLFVDYSFSNKPSDGYGDYYHKITRYIDIISSPAISVDDSISPKTFNAIPSDDESVFTYVDSNSSRSEIGAISDKLKNHRIGIIGLGGTGSYILDLVSKTPVREIHLFDGDDFSQHNAFRSPGAAAIDNLKAPLKKKVDYFKEIYSEMHRHIISHNEFINSDNVEKLLNFDFVFICIDNGKFKEPIIKFLVEKSIPFIDVGMGVERVDDQLIGVLRVTSCSNQQNGHLEKRISFGDPGEDEYAKNIQIADLNMLNASLAVIKWKKLCGFYQDLSKSNFTAYSINDNLIYDEDPESQVC